MPNVFISYRRADSNEESRLIYNALIERFGKDNIFRDKDRIPKGVDFRKTIEQYIFSSDEMLVLIGQEWLNIREDSDPTKRRLDNPEDFVRIEIDMGLRHVEQVTPVVLQNADMPTEEELPRRLVQLGFQNAYFLRPDYFDDDLQHLVEDISNRHQNVEIPQQATINQPNRRFSVIGMIIAIILFLIGLIVVASGIFLPAINNEPTATLDPREQAILYATQTEQSRIAQNYDSSVKTNIAVIDATNTQAIIDAYTDTPTPTLTPTLTNTPTETLTPSNTPTETLTPSNTPTDIPTPTLTDTPTITPSQTPDITGTAIVLATANQKATEQAFALTSEASTQIAQLIADIPTATPLPTATPTFTETYTPIPPTATQIPTATYTLTSTPTDTPTQTPMDTPTATLTDTPTATPTDIPTTTYTPTPTVNVTGTHEAQVNGTATQVAVITQVFEQAVANVGATLAAETSLTVEPSPSLLISVDLTLTAGAVAILEQTNIVKSLNLIQSAERLLLSGDPDVAIALIIEAYRLNSTLSEPKSLLNEAIPLTVRLVIEGNKIVKFDPSGRFLLVVRDDTATLWDVSARQIFLPITAPSTINAIAFSPSGDQLVLGTENNIESWNIIENRQIFSVPNSAVTVLAYHPEEAIVVSGDSSGTVIVWDAGLGTEIMRHSGYDGGVSWVAFQGNGGTIYAYSLSRNSSKAGTLQLLQKTSSFDTSETVYRGLSSNGIYAYAYTGADGSNEFLTLWKANNFVQLKPFERGNKTFDYIDEVDFSDDGKYVLVHSESRDYNDERTSYWIRGRYVAIWDISTSEEIVRFESPEDDPMNWDVHSLALSHNGEMALTGGKIGPVFTVSLWDTSTGQELRRYTGHSDLITEVGFHPDDLYAFSKSQDGTTRVWDILSLESNMIERFDISGQSLGTVGLSTDAQDLYVAYDSKSIGTWEVETGENILGSRFSTDSHHVVAYNTTQPKAFVATVDSAILWNISTGTIIHRFEFLEPQRITSAQFSPDGSLLLINESNMKIYSVETYELLNTISEQPVVFSVNGNNEFLAYSMGNNIIIHDLLQHMQVCEFANIESQVNSIVFSPAGDAVLVALGQPNNRLVKLSTQNCNQLLEMVGHTDSVNSIAFSPTEYLALSGGDDGKVILWDTLTGFPLQTFEGHNAPITQVLYGNDGSTAISVSTDITEGVLKWGIRSARETIEWVKRNRYIIDLSCTQRDQYNIEPKCENGILPEFSTSTPFPTLTPIPTSTLRPTLTPTSTPVPVGIICANDKGNVRIRSGSSEKFKIITTVPSGLEVIILGEKPGWTQVKFEDEEGSIEGWTPNYLVLIGESC